MEGNSLELRERLENLPQELYDEILIMTFTAAGGVVHIDGSFLDPKLDLKLMQVSRATRAKYGCSHYDNTTYIVRYSLICYLLIDSMPAWHRELLKEIQCRSSMRSFTGSTGDSRYFNRLKSEIRQKFDSLGMSASFDYVVS